MKASAQDNNTNKYVLTQKNYVKVLDASNILGISPSSLRRLESEGKITSERLDNNHRAYRVEQINELKKLVDSKAIPQ